MGFQVVIPSHKRPHSVLATRAVTDAIICVPASQASEYAEANASHEILEHSDDLVGLSAKRQWIYDKFGDVVMVDDDVAKFTRVWQAGTVQSSIPPADVSDMLNVIGETAKALGAFLFGPAPFLRPYDYKPQRPFKLTGYVNGACLGLVKGSRLFFHPRAVAVEDFFVSALNAHHHRHCFIDTRFAFQQRGTFKSAGGQAEYRTSDTERQDYEFLRENFGSAIRLKETKCDKGAFKSEYERSLIIPF